MIIFPLSKDYFLTLIKISKYFILFYYYHICLPQHIWSSSTCRKHVPGRQDIVRAQAGPNWVVVGPVLTPLFRIFGPNSIGGSPARLNQKRPSTNDSATALSSSWNKTTLTPPNWVVEDPSNFITHCFLTSSAMATFHEISSSSGNSSSPRNCANKSAIAWLFTALGVPAFRSYCDNCNNH